MLDKLAEVELSQEAAIKQLNNDGDHRYKNRSYLPSKKLENTPSSKSRKNTNVDPVDRKQKTVKLM